MNNIEAGKIFQLMKFIEAMPHLQAIAATLGVELSCRNVRYLIEIYRLREK